MRRRSNRFDDCLNQPTLENVFWAKGVKSGTVTHCAVKPTKELNLRRTLCGRTFLHTQLELLYKATGSAPPSQVCSSCAKRLSKLKEKED